MGSLTLPQVYRVDKGTGVRIFGPDPEQPGAAFDADPAIVGAGSDSPMAADPTPHVQGALLPLEAGLAEPVDLERGHRQLLDRVLPAAVQPGAVGVRMDHRLVEPCPVAGHASMVHPGASLEKGTKKVNESPLPKEGAKRA